MSLAFYELLVLDRSKNLPAVTFSYIRSLMTYGDWNIVITQLANWSLAKRKKSNDVKELRSVIYD